MDAKTFDPQAHMTTIKGKGGERQYLPVSARVMWVRAIWPAADIQTELVRLDDQFALFRATVRLTDDTGQMHGAATGYGSETVSDFTDFIEKAESKALARALSHAGYGTQFALELDEAEPIADTPVPVTPRQTRQNAPGAAQGPKTAQQSAPASSPASRPQNGNPTAGVGSSPISDRQLKFIEQLAAELGLPDEELDGMTRSMFGVQRYSGMSRRDASAFIDALQRRKPATS